jgi:hypothetical protein
MKKIALAFLFLFTFIGGVLASTYAFQDAANIIHQFVTIFPCGIAPNECPVQVLVDSTGTPVGTTGNNLKTTDANAATLLTQIVTNTGSFVPPVSHVQTSAAGSSLVAKNSPGTLVRIDGSLATGAFVMLFDATTAPADGAVTPLKCWGPYTGAQGFTITWGVGPMLSMATGITIVSSSTGCFTKTATNFVFVSVEYQ